MLKNPAALMLKHQLAIHFATNMTSVAFKSEVVSEKAFELAELITSRIEAEAEEFNKNNFHDLKVEVLSFEDFLAKFMRKTEGPLQ